jgi:hypothetical protein
MMSFSGNSAFFKKKIFSRSYTVGLLRDYWFTGFVQLQCKIFFYNLRKFERKQSPKVIPFSEMFSSVVYSIFASNVHERNHTLGNQKKI